jgi:chromosome partitioning protein
MNTIAIINQKGGVGKSTTASAIGGGLTREGAKVLSIDLDPQCNLSYLMEANISGLTQASAIDVLQGNASAAEALQHTSNGDIIAASPALAGADMALTATGKEYRLKEALEALAGQYEYCIIDTPPALGILTVNALTACNGCIIPAGADFLSLQGIGQLHGTISTIRKYCNPGLTVYGIVLTRYNARAVISREVTAMMEETASTLQTRLYKSRIRECTAIKEAQAMRQDIYTYAPRSNAAMDYMALVKEIREG